MNEGMSLIYRADFSHDDDEQTVLLVEAYVKGGKSWLEAPSDPIRIPPRQLVREQFIRTVFISPIVGKIGKNWTGKIIFVDQWRRKYKTDECEFVFMGPTEHPLKHAMPSPSGAKE
jgi:hypothetical protein